MKGRDRIRLEEKQKLLLKYVRIVGKSFRNLIEYF
jgi:hypothetical protein